MSSIVVSRLGRTRLLVALFGAALGGVAACWSAAFGGDAVPPKGDPPAAGDAGMSDPAMDAGMGDAGMGSGEADKPAAKPNELAVLSDADAAPILEGLKKGAKARNGGEVLPVLESLAGKTHSQFEPLLGKLLGHLSVDVAVKAATCLGERPGDKTASTLWKGWDLPINAKRPAARGAILRALGAVGARLDAKQYSDAEKLWSASNEAAAMNGFADYFIAIKDDKRPCKAFAIWIDQPQPSGDPNDGANPPKEWWEARHKLWLATQSKAVHALAAITGQTFSTTDAAKKWFADNPAFGVRW